MGLNNWSVRRINAIAHSMGATKYVEIGVSKGVTFNNVVVPDKVGIDPNFRFDVNEFSNSNTIFFQGTSDEYFSALEVQEKADIYFIDGLHTFEQTYRDLCNSLQHSHGRTVFLVDDIFPDDVYSSIREPSRAFFMRKRAGGDSGSWHGDVFKIAFIVHDFHMAFNYRTIVGSGNPQLLLWSSKAFGRVPMFDSLERISRLDYFDLLDNVDVMRFAKESEAIGECLSELSIR